MSRELVKVLFGIISVFGALSTGAAQDYDPGNLINEGEPTYLGQSPGSAKDLELGEEWVEYRRDSQSSSSSVNSWGQCFNWKYLPNRVLDLIDIPRIDLGLGPSFGVVARASKWLQFGYRQTVPVSLRVGLFGRDWPFMLEHSNEFGVGPFFVNSEDRQITPVEVGAGFDLVFFGIYLGASLDGLFDFVAGVFCSDPGGDDLE